MSVCAFFTSLSVGYSLRYFFKMSIRILPAPLSSESSEKGLLPIILPYWFMMRAQIPFMVRNSSLPEYSPPNMDSNLRAISFVAATVYVSVRIFSGEIPFTYSIYPRRVTRTVVLPLPGTASSSIFPSTVSTASRCLSLKCPV